MIVLELKMRQQSPNRMAVSIAPWTDEILSSDAVPTGRHFTRVLDGRKYSEFLSLSKLGQMRNVVVQLDTNRVFKKTLFLIQLYSRDFYFVPIRLFVMEREALTGIFELNDGRCVRNGNTVLRILQLLYSQYANQSNLSLSGS